MKRPFWLSRWAVFAIGALMLAAAMAAILIENRSEIHEQAEEQLVSRAHFLKKNLIRDLMAVRNSLEHIRLHSISADNFIDTVSATRQLKALAAAMPSTRTMSIVDANGRIVASNRDYLVGRVVDDLDYFITPRAVQDTLFLSRPFLTAAGYYSVHATLAIIGPEGQFQGVVTATLEPDYFTDVLASVVETSDTTTGLASHDGVIFATFPNNSRSLGMNIARPESMFTKHRTSGRPETIWSGSGTFMNQERLILIQDIVDPSINLDKPLNHSVSRSIAAIEKQWREHVLIGIAAYTFLILTVAGIMVAGDRSRRRTAEFDRKIQESQSLSTSILDSLSATIAVVDENGTIIAINSRWLNFAKANAGNDSVLNPIGKPYVAASMLDPHVAEAPAAPVAAGIKAVIAGERDVFELDYPCDAPTEKRWFRMRVHPLEGARRGAVIAHEDITHLKMAEHRLLESEARYRSLFAETVMPMLLIDPEDGSMVDVNAAAATFYGWEAAVLTGMTIQELILPWKGVAPDFLSQADLRIRSCEFKFKSRLADGQIRDIEINSSPVLVGQDLLLLCFLNDISERVKAEEKIVLLSNVFYNTREGIIITDAQNRIIDANDAFTRITGYGLSEVIGQNPRLLSSGRQPKEFYKDLWDGLERNGYWTGEVWNRRKNGEFFAESLTITVLRDADGQITHHVALFSDVTILKEHQNELMRIAQYDALTGLANRVLLADRLRIAIGQGLRRQLPVAVVYLDLDGFKTINDTHGHAVGDSLLIEIARRMKAALREGDTLARIGGDEFVAVLVDLADPNACEQALHRLLTAASETVHVGPLTLNVSASIGVSLSPQDGTEPDQLMRQADQAMYVAKQSGKNRYHFFDSSQDSEVKLLQESLRRIEQALRNQEFVLFYQPKVDMRDGRVVGAEALIRWAHPELGLLGPSAFLPMVEGHDVSIALGEWVIDTALAQMTAWHGDGFKLPVSVNISAMQMQQPNFLVNLNNRLAANPTLPPGSLELELLESSALDNLPEVSALISACKELGVAFSLDDFGTGYSSLTYLRHLPVETIKIDQSFVRDMLDDPGDLAIVEGVMGLATAFQRRSIAEGVETAELAEKLVAMGCRYGQGYGFARPMPADDVLTWASSYTATRI